MNWRQIKVGEIPWHFKEYYVLFCSSPFFKGIENWLEQLNSGLNIEYAQCGDLRGRHKDWCSSVCSLFLPLPHLDHSWWPVYVYWSGEPDRLCNVILDSFTIDVSPMHRHAESDIKRWLSLCSYFQKDRKSWWLHAAVVTYRLASGFKGIHRFSKKFVSVSHPPHPATQNAQMPCKICRAAGNLWQ